MKKTSHIQLVLITAALASCHHPSTPQWQNGNNTFIRSDSTAPYTRMDHPIPGGALLWYYAFRPYGNYYGGIYRRTGYYSDALSETGNIGTNSVKSSVIRGGFGESAFAVES
jgi:hypothetical protein